MQTHLPTPPKAWSFPGAILYSLLNFTLAFGQTPTITTLSPARNATSAPRTSNVSVTFSQAMNAATASKTAIQIQGSQTGTRTLAGKGSFSGTGTNSVTFDPIADFKPGEQVQVSVTNQARSSAGIAIAKSQVYNFTAAATAGKAASFLWVADLKHERGDDASPDSTPNSVCAADLDGDGDVDIFVIARDQSAMIGFNDGTGHFSEPVIMQVSAYDSPYLQAADLDNDGDIDIVYNSRDNLVRLLNDGTGHFPYPSSSNDIPAGNPASVHAADLDGDGDVDLVAPNTLGNSVSILLNDGNAHFSAQPEVPVGNYPQFAYAADVDNDGDLDLAVTNRLSNTVSIRFNDGNARFTGTTEIAVGDAPEVIQMADLDNDGDADLLVATHSTKTNAVFIRLNDGTGHFPTGSEVTGTGPSRLSAADLDGDGDIDFATVNGQVSLYTNDGTGHFSPGTFLSAGNSPNFITTADLDADGDIDISLSNGGKAYSASILLNQSKNDGSCTATGAILQEIWFRAPGNRISDIPLNRPPLITNRITSLRTRANYADDYGQRLRGYICAPVTGNYTFYIQGDDNAELWLSPDNNPDHRQRIALARLAWNWTENASQQSAPINLVAGRSYYVEVLHKEGSGGDLVRVGWRTPDMATNAEPLIIPGSVLSPFENPIRPPYSLSAVAVSTSEIQLTWDDSNTLETGYVIERRFIQEDFIQVAILGANSTSYKDSLLPGNTTCDYRSYAISALGASIYSNSYSRATTFACQATGSILREYWANVPGSSIASIPVNMAPTSGSQPTILRTQANVADNYAQRLRGYLCAPISGNYTFYIQGDDNAELYLSSDNDPANKQRIATASLAWGWHVNASQQSAPIGLVAGRSYYVEVLHKEGSGGDQVRIGWRTPDMAADAEPLIIAGDVLSPFVVPASAKEAMNEPAVTEMPADELTASPNPFSERATIHFTTAATEQARLEVYDLQGRLVGVLYEGLSQAGEKHLFDLDGRHLSRGLYLIKLATVRNISHHELLLAK